MARYRFDGKSFMRTLFSVAFTCLIGATVFALFWEDEPARELAQKRQEFHEKVYLELIVRDALIGLGAGLVLGAALGAVGALSRKPEHHIWGE